MKISVCMATYNGSAFVHKQIESILCQLNKFDELIIVDDCSSDNTTEIISSFLDSRIILILNQENIGVNQSFSKSILAARGDYIFLSDQDDIWLEGRVNLMINHLLKSNVNLLTSNFSWIDEQDNYTFVKFDGVSSLKSHSYFNNILDIFIGKTNYFGCAMLIARPLVKYIVPIPSFVESHDLWIAKLGNLYHTQIHLDDITFYKRIHNSNTTSTVSKRQLISKIYSRFIFTLSIILILFRKQC